MHVCREEIQWNKIEQSRRQTLVIQPHDVTSDKTEGGSGTYKPRDWSDRLKSERVEAGTRDYVSTLRTKCYAERARTRARGAYYYYFFFLTKEKFLLHSCERVRTSFHPRGSRREYFYATFSPNPGGDEKQKVRKEKYRYRHHGDPVSRLSFSRRVVLLAIVKLRFIALSKLCRQVERERQTEENGEERDVA